MANQMLKPVYLKNSELQCGKGKLTDYELLEALNRKVGDNIKCVQLDRDLWRIYLCNNDSKTTLLTEGFELRNQNISVFEFNPYSSGTDDPTEKVLKITIAGVPLSVSDDEIMNMLQKFGVTHKSDLKYEKIRHPVTKKMTGVLNGNRFIYVEPLPETKYLPRNTFCAGLRCKVFHAGQPSHKRDPLCTNCWATDHWKSDCTSEKACKVCKKTGHEPGSEKCAMYVKEQKNIISFQGKDNVLSNFYMCDINCYGENSKSAEHAFQLVKSLRCGDVIAAEKIRGASTALDAKRIDDSVSTSDEWISSSDSVMEEIIKAKVQQVDEFREKLEKSNSKSIFVEATGAYKWGSGLSPEATVHTKLNYWPGQNRLGEIIKKVAMKYQKKPKDGTTPKANKKA